MSFELKNIVPWGRSLEEYTQMFNLRAADLDKKIISFGDGPASFNAETTKQNKNVISLDLIYQFSKDEITQRINETKDVVVEQVKANKENFVWKNIANVDDLIALRMKAMTHFLDDFELGKSQKRYIYHNLPEKTKFENSTFDLGLSSHFLILYSQIGLNFHIQSITEMLRICKEIRIFPIVNLNGEKSEVLNEIIKHFKTNFSVKIEKTGYEFQKNGNEMLVINEFKD